MNVSLLGLLLALLAGPSTPDDAGMPVCPANDPLIREQITRYLGSHDARQILRVPSSVPTTAPQLLTDATHATTCTQLAQRARVARNDGFGLRYAYYTSGGYYFVGAVVVDGQGEYVPRKGRLWVFSPTLSQVSTGLL